MRSLGLDVGDRRIGVALSDPIGILASPLTIISRTDDTSAIQVITAIVSEHQVEQIIVGLPFSMDGSLGEQAEKVKTFVEKLCAHTNVPVDFRDERLTTVTAKRLLQDAQTKKSKGETYDDAAAAAVILQAYLEEFL